MSKIGLIEDADVKDIIRGLNLRVRGFCNYFRWSHAWDAFGNLSHRT
ncbi:MAG TPA: group II intron maturase-specific domain-containing protein [Candidatus Lokiarchaeia archaeon]|nr:group II intron maturase-specific domain-containing protein [Candidatus Lokiarchaeia archaeon]